MSAPLPTVDSLAELARQLSVAERARLIERVAASLAEEADAAPPRHDPYGTLPDLNVSEEDIAQARRDMLRNFPREDIG